MISCASMISFLLRSFSSCGTLSSISYAAVPSSLEYVKIPKRFHCNCFTKLKLSACSSKVSSGNPAIIVVRSVASGISSRILFTRSMICSRLVFLRILFNTALEPCCVGISKYGSTCLEFLIVSINPSSISSGYIYNIRIHAIPSI